MTTLSTNSKSISTFADPLAVDSANLVTTKIADKAIAYLNDTIKYSFTIKNTGTIAADLVVITDQPPVGTTYVPGSLTVSAAFSGDPTTAISLTDPIAPGQTVTLSYEVKVTASPNPNPIQNIATVTYAYTIDPTDPIIITVTSTSNTAVTVVFQNNYSQQISDLINSVALEQAALAAIANSEGAKIQKIVAMGDVTSQELLCLNKSVAEMLDTIALLESILKQKLNVVSCQLDGSTTCP